MSKCNTHLVEWSTNEPPSKSLSLAKSTALTNGTAVSSSRSTSTENLYFFFFIMKAISPLKPGHRTLIPVACNVQVPDTCDKRRSRGSAHRDFQRFHVSKRPWLRFNDRGWSRLIDAFAADLRLLPVVRISSIITLRVLRTYRSHRLASRARKEIHSRLFNYRKYSRSEER